MARVDDRLIHGQVAVKWCKELAVTRIIVASVAIAKNALQVAALKAAAPEGVKAAVVSTEKAISLLSDPRSRNMKILLISNDPRDLLAVFEGIGERPVLDIANYGRIGGNLASKQKLSESVYLTEDDKDVIKKIAQMGVEVIHQALPGDARRDFMSLMG
ncbi:PTS system mannose/fructose/N-acetylgalactosamine-transporter subunit IIB [Thermophilibacter sp. ZX-H3]|uniref:PTS system mannose/fructose/N-acetylgalactosamine-transporter subunit IIB n=1 Tax=unclassified Thermophilibacter TaxID=2847308 RepID=UPI0040409F63